MVPIEPEWKGLKITVAKAELAKNYGLVRMDPYCRLRVGKGVFETPTNYNGAQNPEWNFTFECFIAMDTKSFDLEVFDKNKFFADTRIAWARIVVPEAVFTGGSVEARYHLSGQQGEAKEGTINVIMSLSEVYREILRLRAENNIIGQRLDVDEKYADAAWFCFVGWKYASFPAGWVVVRTNEQGRDSGTTTATDCSAPTDRAVIDTPMSTGDSSARNGDSPARNGDSPATNGDSPSRNGDSPAAYGDSAAANGDSQATESDSEAANGNPSAVLNTGSCGLKPRAAVPPMDHVFKERFSDAPSECSNNSS